MSLVTVLDVSLYLGRRKIFDRIWFQVEPGDRIGLVGPNGAGKTTLLRLLMGEVTPDSGEVRIARGVRVCYLPQDVQETLHGPLLASVIDSVPGRTALQARCARLEVRLKETHDPQIQSSVAEQLAQVHQEIERLESQFPRHEAERILLGLGFEASDFDTPVARLSGGWKTRAALASLLYQRPDLLLLDEPTNHLDIPSVRWLEQFLRDFPAAMVLVSHDREFLNRQTNRTVGFEPEGMRSHHGNYERYLKTREEERALLEARARNQEQKVKEARKFIDRFRAKASKARQAQSKIKLVKKMELVETHRPLKTVRFAFPPVTRSGRDVLRLEGITKAFGPKILYRDLHLRVLRGERVAVIGPNGCGKTTLLRMVAGEIRPDQGKLVLGHGVVLSYFAQHHSEMLDARKTVLQEVADLVPHASIGFVRGVCGAFLFSGEDVDKPIGVLSGGERARVSLAKLLVAPGNFMVMDEPTNHLDIASSEKLVDALQAFEGTLLFVSHNQSFINRLATKIWDIRQGDVIEYPGNLTEYEDHLRRSAREAQEDRPQASGILPQPELEDGRSRPSRKALKRERAEKRRRIQETLKPVQARLVELEETINRLETRQRELEAMLSDPEVFRDAARSTALTMEYREVKARVDTLLLEWEQEQEALTSIKQRLGVP